jgi:hypothetical protein
MRRSRRTHANSDPGVVFVYKPSDYLGIIKKKAMLRSPGMVKKKNLHVRIEEDVYEKLRHVTFYERNTISEVIRRLIAEYLEEKATDEPNFVAPHRL